MSLGLMASNFVQSLPDERKSTPAPSRRVLHTRLIQTHLLAPRADHLVNADIDNVIDDRFFSTDSLSDDVTQTNAADSAEQVSQSKSQQTTAAATLSTLSSLSTQLSEWIPTETIAVYIAGVALIGNPSWPTPGCTVGYPSLTSPDFWLWFAVVAGAVSSPAIVYWLAELQARTQSKKFAVPKFQMVASFVAFVAWALYLPNSVMQHCMALPNYGPGLILIAAQFGLWLFALKLKAEGKLSVDLATPVVSDSERNGSILTQPAPDKPDVNINDAPGNGGGAAPVPVNGLPSEVLANAEIIPIFLGDAWKNDRNAQSMRTQCVAFLNQYVQSATFADLSVYGVGQAAILGDIVAPMNAPSGCGDDVIQAILRDLVTNGSIQPKPKCTLAMFFLPPGFAVSGPEGTTCIRSCGYHQMAECNVPYALVPYVAAGCGLCVTSGRSATDSMMSSICHELCEAVTDPDPRANGGWKTPGGQEIADQCASLNSAVAGHVVQQIYINGKGCV